jgi:uncharacterized protein YjbI with pentapeptide repeats
MRIMEKTRSKNRRGVEREYARTADLALIEQGVDVWNAWRIQNHEITPDLCGANLSGASLAGAHLVDTT